MKILILVVSFLMVGCSMEVSGWAINKAVKFCKDKGGIIELSNVNNVVICGDGSYKHIKVENAE